MAVVWNVILGILGSACLFPLVMGSFLFPEFPAFLDVLLRIFTAVFFQWLFCRLGKKKMLLRWIPVMITGAIATWGFFLYLTAPSWINAGFGAFFRDYGLFFLSCLITILVWSIVRRVRRVIHRERMRKRALQHSMGKPPKKK